MAKEGPSVESKKAWLLKVVCEITVLPGNPTKSSLEGDDWDAVSCFCSAVPYVWHLFIFSFFFFHPSTFFVPPGVESLPFNVLFFSLPTPFLLLAHDHRLTRSDALS